ncbi:MAG: hypothetical protein H0W90_07145 [Actinobacteria bacterium]|nr:hypothetical protein [Actinomycetota bacterium]
MSACTGTQSSNDDRPASDPRGGQELVFKLFDAMINSPLWPRMLAVITYDEPGGFFDQ